MYTITLTPNSFAEAGDMFDRLAAAQADRSELMQDLGELLMQSTKDRFPTGQAPDGTPWAPKSQATLDSYRSREARKRNASVPFRPLFGPSGRLSSEIFYEAGPQSVEIGSALIYAAVMQEGAEKGAFGSMANGSPIPWGDIPARPFLGLSPDDETNVQATVEEWLERVAQTGN